MSSSTCGLKKTQPDINSLIIQSEAGKKQNKMHPQQQYLISEQPNSQQAQYEQIAKILEQQQNAYKYDKQIPLLTHQSWLPGCGDGEERLGSEGGSEGEGLRDGRKGLLEILKRKIVALFTDYITKCRQLLDNVEFVGRGTKRDRKQHGDAGYILMYIVEANQLFAEKQANFMASFLSAHTDIRQLISELISSTKITYRDQVLYCLYHILDSLKENQFFQSQSSSGVGQKIQEACLQIHEQIIMSNKLSQLLFKEYGCESECQGYLKELLVAWMGVIADLQNGEEEKYQDELEELDEEDGERAHGGFRFEFRAEMDEDDGLGMEFTGRKMKPL